MSSSRSKFLRGLGARLQSDIALRAAERDEAAAGILPEHIDELGGEQERPGEQIAGDRIDTAAASPPAQIASRRDAEPEALAPAQPPRHPGDTIVPSGPPDGAEDLGPYPAASWAEAGIPLRLRDAIASVRRVSHELYQGPPRDHDAMPAPALSGPGADDDFLSERDPAFISPADDGPAGPDDHPAEKHGQILAYRSPSKEILFDDNPIVNDPVPTGNELREFERAFAHDQVEPEDDAAPEEPTARDEFVLEDDEHTRILDDSASYHTPETGGEATQAWMRPHDDDGDAEAAPGVGEELNDRPPARRGTTAGYGVHVTAVAAAIVFVALAGFGFGMLSDSRPPESPPAHDMATAAPAPSSARPSLQPAATQKPAPLEELITVRVAPPPGDALTEPTSVTPTTTLPLPPPPKPDLPQAATDRAPSDGQRGDAADAAASAPSLAEEPADGAVSSPLEGGPFEPLFAKLPGSRATAGPVLVHYMASAAGGPATAIHLVRQLEAAGFAVEARAVQFPIAANSIRYFFPGDRDQAEALRASLESELPSGAALSVMDFSSLEPKPQEGHLEVWLRS